MKTQLFKKILSTTAVLSVLFYGYSYGQAGTLDSTFGVNGKVTFQQAGINVERTALQADGKFIAVGNHYDSTTSQIDFCAVRFNQDGFIDSSFGTNGMKSIAVSPNFDKAEVAAVQTDGKIVLAGYSTGAGTLAAYFSLARCNSDGSIDSTFGVNGIKTFSLQGSYNDIRSIAIEPDSNKIVIGGIAGTLTNQIPVLARLKMDGSFDSSFADNGIYMAPSNSVFGYPTKLKLQSDNKIVFLSNTIDSICIVRLNENGTPDNTFGNAGIVTTSFNGHNVFGFGLVIQPNGKILVSGSESYTISSSAQNIVVVRYNTDGSLDNSFGTGGKLLTLFDQFNTAYSVTVQPSDNKIVLAGERKTATSGKSDFLVARLNPDGTKDTEFGNSGYAITIMDSVDNDNISTVYILSDGKILATGGIYQGRFAATRYNSCGISITGQPANQTKGLGATASFTVNSTSPSAGYQWQTKNTPGWTDLSDGGQYSGSQSATLQVSNITVANDQQQFRAIALSGVCSDTSSAALLTVDTSLGIGRIALNAGFRLYPNPVNEHLTIATKALSDRIVEVTITDLAGKIILHRQLKGQSSVTLSSKTWAAGMYIAKVRLKGKAPQALKIVKK